MAKCSPAKVSSHQPPWYTGVRRSSCLSPSNKKAGISGSCAQDSWVPVPELLGWEWLRYVEIYILNWGNSLQHWVRARWLWAHRASWTEVGEETENHEKHSTYLNMGSLHASQTFHTFSLMVVLCHIASMLICGGRFRPPPSLLRVAVAELCEFPFGP